MSRGKSGPRQPGGGRQQAGPRHQARQARHQSFRHPEVRAQRAVPRPAPPVAGAERLQAAGKVQTVSVTADESGMRVDRFFEARFPGLSFSHIQRIIRKGEVRVNGKRTQPKARLEAGQAVRIPPLKVEAPAPRDDAPAAQKDRAFLKSIILFEDADVMVLNKPMGLAVQGGSGTTRHIDGMLGALRGPDGQRPRLVHRLGQRYRRLSARREDAICGGSARKDVPLALGAQDLLGAGCRRAKAGAGTHFYISGQAGSRGRLLYAHRQAWREGCSARGHLLRSGGDGGAQVCVDVAETGDRSHPSVASAYGPCRQPDCRRSKIFQHRRTGNSPVVMQNKLHLLARRIAVPHPRGGIIDVSAPLPPHMEQSWNLLGFDAKRYDPIEEAPEE